MPRISVPLDADTFRALQFKAAGARRDVRDQAAHELERALVGVFHPGPPPEAAPEQKSGAPGQPWPGPRRAEKGNGP